MCASKDTVNEKTSHRLGKVFAHDIHDEGLVTRIYKEFLKFSKNFKNGQKIVHIFHRRRFRTANKSGKDAQFSH